MSFLAKKQDDAVSLGLFISSQQNPNKSIKIKYLYFKSALNALTFQHRVQSLAPKEVPKSILQTPNLENSFHRENT